MVKKISVLSVHEFIRTQWLIRAVFGFQENGAAFEAFQAVPLANRDVNDGAPREHVDGVGQVAVVIVEVLHKMSPHTKAGLRRTQMPVYGHICTWLNGVEHPLRLILFRIAQIHIAPQP